MSPRTVCRERKEPPLGENDLLEVGCDLVDLCHQRVVGKADEEDTALGPDPKTLFTVIV